MQDNNKATWIWYPGDFEVWLGNKFNNRRTERGSMFPPFWKQDSHWPTVVFTKEVNLVEAEIITIVAEGQYNFTIDGKLQSPRSCGIPKGRHQIGFKVWNQASPPALFVKGKAVHTDSTWQVTYEDKIWIDENGVAHGSGIYVPVGSWNFNSPTTPPSQYKLERRAIRPVRVESVTNGRLYDFGREVFGYLRLTNQEQNINVYYGESREEALDKEHCETLDVLTPEHRAPDSKAFRYVYIEVDFEARYDDVLVEFEYASHDDNHSGMFRCSDNELNKIWEVSAYTMDLTTREFFVDGIKRDRWVWSGDAIQSYLMNYYLRYDTECVKRTIRQLRGKDPVTTHVNTIMDYTFYWFKSIMDYYDYTGDLDFIRELWPKMVTLMDYVLSRTNTDGMAEGKADDWIFVDWTDFPMHKRGVLCFEQILLCKALEIMAKCEVLLSRDAHGVCCHAMTTNTTNYATHAATLRQNIKATFWDEASHAYLHAIEDGKLNTQITKFPNTFAILYGLADTNEQRQITDSVLINPDIPAITTPYMRFYELEALCQMGRQDDVLREMKAYWGGMLREGATTFWEKYNPDEHDTEHLAMYGRPYGKSLCHAWGASPIYILGRYFLGIQPTKPGYEEYEIRPTLGGLAWIEGEVPTPFGKIRITMDQHQVTVHSDGGNGRLIIDDLQKDIPANQEITFSY